MPKAIDCFRTFVQERGVLSGDLVDCFTEFLGVTPRVITRWVRGENEPNGETLIKLTILMEMLGVLVDEMPEREEDRLINNLIAFGVASASELAEKLGYSQANVLNFALNRRKISRPGGLTDFVYDDRSVVSPVVLINDGRGELGKKLQILLGLPDHVTDASERKLLVSAVVEAFGVQVKATTSLAVFLNSDQCTDADRALVLEVSAEDMMELRQALVGLSSKTARDRAKHEGDSHGR
jgi:hypothetical protein